jgi:hypothetical protein
MCKLRRLSLLFLAACLLCPHDPCGGKAAGEDFRIDNRVFSGSQKRADYRGTTIFSAGVVYDYRDDPAEVIVLDKAAGRFILLDAARQSCTELKMDEVAAFSARMKQWAAGHSDPLIRFFGEPKFQEQFGAGMNQLTLSSPWMTYQARLTAVDSASMAQQYRDFSDWYAQINWLLNPGSRPPFARLMLNEAIARQHGIAREVTLTITSGKDPAAKRTTIRSEHDLVPQLTKADLARVAQTRGQVQSFKPIGFEQYRKVAAR